MTAQKCFFNSCILNNLNTKEKYERLNNNNNSYEYVYNFYNI